MTTPDARLGRNDLADRSRWGVSALLVGCGFAILGCESGTKPGNSPTDPPGLVTTTLAPAKRADTVTAGNGAEILGSIPLGAQVRSISFTPDGKTLVAADDDAVTIWDLTARRLTRKLDGQPTPVSASALSRDGATIATAAYRFEPFAGIVMLWDRATGTSKATPANHPRAVNGLAFAPDGSYLALATSAAEAGKSAAEPPGVVLVIERPSGKVKASLGGHSQSVPAVAVSPDGKTLASISMKRGPNFSSLGELIVWNVPDAKERARPKAQTGPIHGVAFSPDGADLLVAFDDLAGKPTLGFLNPIDAQTRRTITTIPDDISALAVAPDGSTIALGRQNGSISIVDYQSGNVINVPAKHVGVVTCLAFASDSKTLASGGRDRQAILWDVPAMRGVAASPTKSK